MVRLVSTWINSNTSDPVWVEPVTRSKSSSRSVVTDNPVTRLSSSNKQKKRVLVFCRRIARRNLSGNFGHTESIEESLQSVVYITPWVMIEPGGSGRRNVTDNSATRQSLTLTKGANLKPPRGWIMLTELVSLRYSRWFCNGNCSHNVFSWRWTCRLIACLSLTVPFAFSGPS